MPLSGYSYYRTITIDHTKVPNTDRANYPVYVGGTYSWLATVANGGLVQSSSGYDIVFSTDKSTVLNFERVSWNASTGAVEFYVNVASVSHTTDIVLYIYYGNAAISTDQQNAASTWDSNFKNVYHFQESTGTTNADSTTNAVTATKQSSGHPSSVTGKIGNGVSFNGTSDYESLTAMTSGDKTVEAWINMSSWAYDGGGVAQRIIFCNIDGTNAFQLSQIHQSSGNGNFDSFAWGVNDSTGQVLISGNSNLSTSTWYYVVGVWTASSRTAVLYVNATSTSGGGATGYGIASSGSTFFGKRQDGSGFFSGTMDEVRISTAVRSADWITTTYNQLATTFYTVGSQTSNTSSSTRTITATAAALLQTSTRTITSTVALLATKTRTITATAALLQPTTRSITATAALLQTSTRTITASAALQTTSTRAIISTAALLQPSTRTITCTASLAGTARVITCTAALLATSTRTIATTAALQLTSTRTISTSAALLQANTRTITATAALLATQQRSIISTAALQLTEVRTITATTALLATQTRIITCTAALGGTSRTIVCAAALMLTQSRIIVCTAALSTSNSTPTTNCTFYVRSGKATFYVRSGSATFKVRS